MYVLLGLNTLSQLCCDKACQCSSYTFKLASEVVVCRSTTWNTYNPECKSGTAYPPSHLCMTTSPDLHRSYNIALSGQKLQLHLHSDTQTASLLLYTPNQSDSFSKRRISA